MAGKVQLQCGYREGQCWKSAKLEVNAKSLQEAGGLCWNKHRLKEQET